MKARTTTSVMRQDGEASHGAGVPARKLAGRGESVAASRRTSAQAPRCSISAETASNVHLCIPEEQLMHFPNGQAMPTWPAGAPVPQAGEVIYLTSTSAWAVRTVIHEFMRGSLRTEVWLEWIGSARHLRDPRSDFVH